MGGKAIVPIPPTGTFFGLQTCFAIYSLISGYLWLLFDVNTLLHQALHFTTTHAVPVALCVVAIVAQVVVLPSFNQVIVARAKFNIGHPIHHPAPGELGLSDDERIQWLCRLRAYDNICEMLTQYIAHAVALTFAGFEITVVVLSITYLVGRVHYGVGYGVGDPRARIPGIIVAQFMSLLIMRGLILLYVARNFLE